MVAVAKVVFKMVALVFQRVKGFVFYLPSCPSSFDQSSDIFFIDSDVGHPTIAIGGLFISNDAVVKKVDLIGIFRAIERYIINSSAFMLAALFIVERHLAAGL